MAGNARLPRTARLGGAENFRLAFASRRKLQGQWLALHHRQRTGDAEQGPRLGLVIGKRLCRQSTRRNFIKRMIREQFRRIREDLGTIDLVVRLVRSLPPRLDPETRRRIGNDLAQLFVKLNQVPRRPN